jgi:hypothetical protein
MGNSRNFMNLFCVVFGDEGVSGALSAATTRPADSMDVIFDL